MKRKKRRNPESGKPHRKKNRRGGKNRGKGGQTIHREKRSNHVTNKFGNKSRFVSRPKTRREMWYNGKPPSKGHASVGAVQKAQCQIPRSWTTTKVMGGKRKIIHSEEGTCFLRNAKKTRRSWKWVNGVRPQVREKEKKEAGGPPWGRAQAPQ